MLEKKYDNKENRKHRKMKKTENTGKKPRENRRNGFHGMNKSGSALLIVFFVSVVVVIFYLAFMQGKLSNPQEERTAQVQRSYLASYQELMKKYAYHALRISGTIASYESAEKGADNQEVYWERYGQPFPPDLEFVKKLSIGARTLPLCDSYLKNIYNKSFGKLIYSEIGNISEISIWIEEPDLVPNATDDAKFDEYFDISGRGYSSTLVESEIENESRSFYHDYTTTVYPWRYFFLYRKIRQWINERCLPQTTCEGMPLATGYGHDASCPTTCPASPDSILKACVTSSNPSSLQSEFDDHKDQYVKCEYKIYCEDTNRIVLKNEISCEDSNGNPCCPEPVKNPQCVWGMACGIPCPSRTCKEGICQADDTIPAGVPKVDCAAINPPPVDSCTGPICDNAASGECFSYGEYMHISFIALITCTDSKYKQPISQEGYKELVYNIWVHVALTHTVPPPSFECTDTCIPKPVPPPPPPPPPQCPQSPIEMDCGCCGKATGTCDPATGAITYGSCTGEYECTRTVPCIGMCSQPGNIVETCTPGIGWRQTQPCNAPQTGECDPGTTMCAPGCCMDNGCCGPCPIPN